MKKSAVFLIVFLVIIINERTYSQNYLISFAGTGASTTVDSVKVENLARCTDTVILGSDILQLTGAVGLNNALQKTNDRLMVFPNPSTGNCFINIEQSEAGNALIEIFDITGKIIVQNNVYLLNGINCYSLAGAGTGIYIVSVKSDKGYLYSKLISANGSNGSERITFDRISSMEITQDENNNLLKKYEKGRKSTVQMLYFNGERLKFTGYSGGIYRTVYMLVPTQNESITFNFVACTDIDGNNYAVVQIGTQIWMAENLKTTHYRNGDIIQYITDNTQWQNMGAGARCYYNNDSTAYAGIYGCFYNGFAVGDTRILAPLGWHCPSQTEFNTLSSALGGSGGAIKDPCCTLWTTPNTGANNSSGFSGLPLGFRSYYGSYMYFATKSIYWGTGERIMWVNNNDAVLNTGASALQYGQSVRCIKD